MFSELQHECTNDVGGHNKIRLNKLIIDNCFLLLTQTRYTTLFTQNILNGERNQNDK